MPVPQCKPLYRKQAADIAMLMEEGVNICIGTDSLASNHQLCILTELYTIKQRHANINWETLLTWATYNGALALQMQHTIGSMEIGKKPGIINITHLNETGTKPLVKRVS